MLLPASVFVLMVSVGMSLRWQELVANWRRLTWSAWLRLLLATFIVPPAVALLLARILPLNLSETAGLFMVAAAPGAPLLTRNLARRGFDMHLAASYQVWGAVMTPIMIPLLVAGAAKLYARNIWIPPTALVVQIVEKEFVPLLVGMALAHFMPVFSKKVQTALNILGNCTLTLVFVVLLWKMGPELRRVTPWVVLAAVLLVASSVAAMGLLMSNDRIAVRTLAASNANRHVGLALLLSGQYIHNRDALPAVACYAIIVALLMILAPKLLRQKELAAPA
jgi:BASS family bile acid:Na+ symporter